MRPHGSRWLDDKFHQPQTPLPAVRTPPPGAKCGNCKHFDPLREYHHSEWGSGKWMKSSVIERWCNEHDHPAIDSGRCPRWDGKVPNTHPNRSKKKVDNAD